MRKDPRDRNVSDWVPLTKLGRLVKAGEIATMTDVLNSGLSLREPEIVDLLMPDLEDDVIDVNMVQRMTDSGRRVRFRVAAVVGNRNGFVGLGQAKGREVGPTIRRAIDNAKLNMTQLRRGCGSWECGCFTPHTVPFAVTGKTASVQVTLKPAPRGVGLAAGDIAKQVLTMAGIHDVWALTGGQTRTTINFAKATFEALRETSRVRVTDAKRDQLKMIEGPVVTSVRRGDAHEAPEDAEAEPAEAASAAGGGPS